MSTYKDLLGKKELLEEAIEAAYREESAQAIVQVKGIIADYGLTAKDCGFNPVSSTVTSIKPVKWRAPARVKFCGPNGETWTGKGRKPLWLVALIEAGHSCGEYLIEKEAA